MQRQNLYVSPNGDRWELGNGPDGDVHVFHTPNEASGGRPSSVAVETFVDSVSGSPEYEAVRKLIRDGSLKIANAV